MLQNRVILRKEDHTYIDTETGDKLISWSRFIDNFFHKFDPAIAKNCAGKGKYVGMTEADVLKSWEVNRDKAAGHGTRIHDANETYSKTFTIAQENKDLEPMLMSISAEHKGYYQVYDEEVLALIEEGIAGTADKIFLLNNRKDSPFDVEDFKTNLDKGIEFIPGEKVKDKWCKYPINHLPNCSYTKYALQLSMYAYMFSKWSGRKPRKLQIRYIPPGDMLQHVVIPVTYLLMEVKALISEWQLMKSIMKSNKQTVNQFIETPNL